MNNLFPEIDEQPPLLEQEIPTNDYEFATGDLSSFMHTFEEEKEDMDIEQLPTSEEFSDAGIQNLPTSTARKTGKFIAHMTDYALATGLGLISGLPTKEHQADNESKKELESIITEYIKESGGEIPLFVQLLICLTVTYGLQIPGAIKIRKEHAKTSQNDHDNRSE